MTSLPLTKPLLAALATGVIALILINHTIWQKERILSHGRLIYLPLAPVDPRSIMQGDYMTLQFALVDDLTQKIEQTRSATTVALLNVDPRGVAHLAALGTQKPTAQQVRFRYRHDNNGVRFGTDAFFFQEGHAQHYEAARFGGFRVDADGHALLTDLYDDKLRRLGTP